MSIENFVLRVEDVDAIIDQLKVCTDDSSHNLYGRLDLDKNGMASHSFGAKSTQGVSGQVISYLTFTDVTGLSVLEMLFTRNPAYHPEMAALSTAFWDSWLLGDSAARAWLEGDSGLTVLQSQDTWQFK